MPSNQERDRRYAALRAMMQEKGYHALILAGNAEAMQRGYIRYVADWRLWGGTAGRLSISQTPHLRCNWRLCGRTPCQSGGSRTPVCLFV